MTMPVSLNPNTTTLQRFVSVQPVGLSRDPLPKDALRFQVTGLGSNSCVAKVENGWLTIQPSTSAVTAVSLDLRDYTLTTLAAYFTANTTGYTVTVAAAAGSENLKATVLLEGTLNLASNSADNIWPMFTSTLYAYAMACALLHDDMQRDLAAMKSQTDQRTGMGKWADKWGMFLGVARAIAGGITETDAAYRKRVQREAVFFKSNNVAIEILIEAATGLRSVVTDGGSPFILPIIGLTAGTPLPNITNGETGASNLSDPLAPQAGQGNFTVQMLDVLGNYTVADITNFVTKWKPAGVTFAVQTVS